jgi:hypothetical protein
MGRWRSRFGNRDLDSLHLDGAAYGSAHGAQQDDGLDVEVVGVVGHGIDAGGI